MSTTLRLDRLIGREVLTANNRRLGKIEECRAELRGDTWVLTEWLIGPLGLFERLGLAARLLIGSRRAGYVARWDQIDLSNPDRPRLTCVVDALRRA